MRLPRNFSPYKRGRVREYRVMKTLQKHGYYTMRSAGSHGYFDVIAIKPPIILFIQVKSRRWVEKSIIDESVKLVSGLAHADYIITYTREGKRFYYSPRLNITTTDINEIESVILGGE